MLSCLVYLHTEPRSAESYPRPLALFTPSFEGSLEGLPLSPLRPAVFFPNLQPSNAPFASRAGLRGLPTFQRSVSRPLPLRAPKSFRMHTYKSLSKQRTLISFRMIDLQKRGVGGVLWLTNFLLSSAFHHAAESPNYPLHVQFLTNCPFSIPFVLTFMHRMGAVGGTSHQSQVTDPLCPTGYLSRGRASSVLLEPTSLSNKLSTDHRSFFSCVGGCDG